MKINDVKYEPSTLSVFLDPPLNLHIIIIIIYNYTIYTQDKTISIHIIILIS